MTHVMNVLVLMKINVHLVKVNFNLLEDLINATVMGILQGNNILRLNVIFAIFLVCYIKLILFINYLIKRFNLPRQE